MMHQVPSKRLQKMSFKVSVSLLGMHAEPTCSTKVGQIIGHFFENFSFHNLV